MKDYSNRVGIGRPKGYKMSDESKQKISDSKTGQKQDEKTRERISKGVKKERHTGAPINIIMTTDIESLNEIPTKSGYVNVAIPNPVCGQPSFVMRKHVALMEKELGRKLQPGEEVHHWSSKDNNEMMILTLCKDRKHHRKLDRSRRNIKKEIQKSIDWSKKHKLNNCDLEQDVVLVWKAVLSGEIDAIQEG